MAKMAGLKEKRAASLLKELLAEAMGTLRDEVLQGVSVVDVEVRRGMYDANVYIDKSIFSDVEQKEILKHLKRAAPVLQSYCLEASGWFKCPKFHFKFDESFEQQKRIEDLFEKIKEEKSQ